MLKRLTLSALLSCSLLFAGAASAGGAPVPLQLPPPVEKHGLSAGDFQQLVKQAATLRKFRVADANGNRVRLAYPTGARSAKFEATFDVTYRDGKIWIELSSSRGLNEGPCSNGSNVTCIHRNVNRWMKNLAADLTTLSR